MKRMNRRSGARGGFTLIELVTVIVILGILSAVALPIYLDYRTDAKSAACKGTLGAVRAAVANFYAYTATPSGGGTATYPTLGELSVVGKVLIDTLPANPYNDDNTVVAGTTKGTVAANAGWVYNAANGQFWAATNTAGENGY